jgi:hypothetical protein
MGNDARSRRSLPWLVAWLVFTAYFLAARGVQNFFPLSVFPMYQRHAPDVVGRILVLDGRGRETALDRFESFRCEPERPAIMSQEHCGRPEVAFEYLAREHQVYLDAHLGDGGPVELRIVSRVYHLSAADDGVPSEDCEIARCSARPRGEDP